MNQGTGRPEHLALRRVGRYVIYGAMASGGMATVHFGRLTGVAGFARTVAVKRMHAALARDPEFVAMFIDEARLAARIQHANVVETIDVVAMDEELLLVMAYIPGEALSRLVSASSARGERIPERIALAIVYDMLQGLHAAHEARDEQNQPLAIVHRDVSPQNVLIGLDGAARIHDFGTAKARRRIQNTRDGQIKGKLAYMAPEQLCADAVDARCDVYAAGVVLWELLTLERFVTADTQEAMLKDILVRPQPSLAEASPHSSPGLRRIVERALSRDREHRFPTARDMAIALEMAAPIARAREVGDWLGRLAAEGLAQRASVLSRIEASPPVSAQPFDPAGEGEGDADDLPTRVQDRALPDEPAARRTR
jgi:eukaryotic-like serine/threonine-protein kinase